MRGGSLQLGTLFGIPMYVHWTFGLLLGWIAFSTAASGGAMAAILFNLAFVITIFACVVLHELGHALAARRYGIDTRDVTLLPIGGVARLERMPRKPSQELVVALAGPLVNVVIAGLLFAICAPVGAPQFASGGSTVKLLLEQVMWANAFLVVFNLIPAFPMDGGRVLRAVLAMFTRYDSATWIAARVGQVLAVGFAILGLFVIGNPLLLLIAVFVFLGAAAEARQVQMRTALEGYRVRDGMITRFQVVSPWASLREVAPQLLDSQQEEFPVVEVDRYLGMLRREHLVAALRGEVPDRVAADVMDTSVPVIQADDSLSDVADKEMSGRLLPVVRDGRLAGVLNLPAAWEIVRARMMHFAGNAFDSWHGRPSRSTA